MIEMQRPDVQSNAMTLSGSPESIVSILTNDARKRLMPGSRIWILEADYGRSLMWRYDPLDAERDWEDKEFDGREGRITL